MDDIGNFFTHTIPDTATTAYHETEDFFTNTVPNTATSTANTVAGGVTQIYNTTVTQTTQGFQQMDTAIKNGGTIILNAVSTAVQVAGQMATQVITGIRVLVNTVVNGVQQTLSLVLETVEQATRFVGTLLESLGAKLQDLLNYIKALFNWSDILATEQVIEHALIELKRVAAEAVASLAQGAYVDQGITRLRTLIDTNFDSWVAALGGPAPGGGTPPRTRPRRTCRASMCSRCSAIISSTRGAAWTPSSGDRPCWAWPRNWPPGCKRRAATSGPPKRSRTRA